MQTPEQGPVGPDTRDAIAKIEAEWRAKMGLPPIENAQAETPAPSPSDSEVTDLLALREKWSTRDVSDH